MTEEEANRKAKENSHLLGERWVNKNTKDSEVITQVIPHYMKEFNTWVIYIYFEPVIEGGLAKARGVTIDKLFRDYNKLNG